MKRMIELNYDPYGGIVVLGDLNQYDNEANIFTGCEYVGEYALNSIISRIGYVKNVYLYHNKMVVRAVLNYMEYCE